jgi:hypothetical protein
MEADRDAACMGLAGSRTEDPKTPSAAPNFPTHRPSTLQVQIMPLLLCTGWNLRGGMTGMKSECVVGSRTSGSIVGGETTRLTHRAFQQ